MTIDVSFYDFYDIKIVYLIVFIAVMMFWVMIFCLFISKPAEPTTAGLAVIVAIIVFLFTPYEYMDKTISFDNATMIAQEYFKTEKEQEFAIVSLRSGKTSIGDSVCIKSNFTDKGCKNYLKKKLKRIQREFESEVAKQAQAEQENIQTQNNIKGILKEDK